MRLKVLGSAEDALRAMTEQLIEKMNMRGISPFHLALSVPVRPNKCSGFGFGNTGRR